MKLKHVNIPIFIPHLGCPNDCAFCNQRSISGRVSFCLDAVPQEIEAVLATVPAGAETEIAFFGGSFTGIDRGLMTDLLGIAEAYVRAGRVTSIRLSTRPDYIDEEILALLRNYRVKTVELGLQSLDDKVLVACRRGHTAERAKIACRMVKEAGFALVGQMMTGLPEATGESEVMTAETICSLGADGARIYPTVVLKDTALQGMLLAGCYTPLSEEEAIVRAADAYEVFLSHGVPVLRVGLHASEGLEKEHAVAGYHPAMGDLTEGEIYYRRTAALLATRPDLRGQRVEIVIPKGALSLAIGQNGRNRRRLCEKFALVSVRFVEEEAPPFAVALLEQR